jgi:hypothetical protein
MKDWPTHKYLAMMFGTTVCVSIFLIVGGIVFSKVPTNPDNAAIRAGVFDLIKIISGSLLTFIAMEVKEYYKNKL